MWLHRDTQLTLRAMIVDDEPLARDELAFMLGELGVDVIAEASNAKEALSLLEACEPEVAFLDLRMPGPDGITLAETIRVKAPSVHVVMISAHDDGAFRAIGAEVTDYLLKPVRLDRLKDALARVERRRGAITPSLDRIAVKRDGAYVVVEISEVLFFHVKDEVVWAVTHDDRFALDLSLSAIVDQVSADEFFRSHRSALVRLGAIAGLEPAGSGAYDLVMNHPDAPRLPLSRDRVRLLRQHIPIAG